MIIVLLIKFIYMLRVHMKQKKCKKNGLEDLKDFKTCIKYSNNMQDVYKNIEEYNPNGKCNVLIVFDDMTADMISNKKLSPIVTELFIKGRKLKISTVFITQSYFQVPNDVRLNYINFLS